MGSIAALIPLIAGGSGLVVVILVMRAMPRATFTLWALLLFFVPVWIGVNLSGSFSVMAISALTLLALVAFGGNVQLSLADFFVGILVVFAVVEYVLGAISITYFVIALVEWLLPYAWGRVVLSRVSGSFVTKCLAVCATVAAALAIVEFLTSVNLFTMIPLNNYLYSVWGPLQDRAGMLRAEGAWGHSIALGAALGMTSTFVLTAPWRTSVRVVSLAVVIAGAVLTLSRIGLVTLALAVILTVVLMPQIGRSTRIGVTITGLIGVVVMMPTVMSVFSEAGSEASGSADYRSEIFSLFSYVKLFGAAPSLRGITVGGDYLGSYAKSIDNAILLTGLRLGWVVLAAFCAVLAVVVLSLFIRGRANPASIAVAAQIPGLFAVALITQFGTYFWFLAGLAVAWNNMLRESDSQDPPLSKASEYGGEDASTSNSLPLSISARRHVS